MGTDKSALVVAGLSMLDRATRALRDAGITTLAVPGSAELPDPTGSNDGSDPLGPLAGIVSGWAYFQRGTAPDTVVVLSCDLPAIPARVVTALVEAAAGSEHGAVAHDGERRQPLIAAYHAVALRSMAAAFHAGQRSVRRCLEGWDLGICHFDRTVLLDADTPADLNGFDVRWPAR